LDYFIVLLVDGKADINVGGLHLGQRYSVAEKNSAGFTNCGGSVNTNVGMGL